MGNQRRFPRIGRPLALLLIASGCANLPRDQQGWTERIERSGVLTVGVSRDGATSTALEAHEKQLVETLARRLRARIEWRPNNAHALLQDLQERRLPLVAASVSCDSPFAQHVGLSKPYVTDGPLQKDYCLAVAPGENRLLLLVDRIIAEDRRRPNKP